MANQTLPTELLPHDKEAEQALLGAIILRNDILLELADTLEPTDFFSPAHQRIYQAMRELAETGVPVDEVTLGVELRRQDSLELTGGATYIAELANHTPVVGNVSHYAQIVRDRGRLRELILTAHQIADKGRDSSIQVEDLLLQANSALQNIESRQKNRSYEALKDVLMQNFETLERRSETGETVTGIATGFVELDELTHGLQSSDLIIIAARPSMGKTAFALNIALHAALAAKATTLVFSLEMPREQLGLRMLCSESRVDTGRIQVGRLEQEDWDKLSVAAARMMEAKLFIDDKPGINSMYVRKVARQVSAEAGGLGLIVIDYLQLMTGHTRTNSREQEISEISRTLKSIAKEFGVPVIALSQLNRDLERRQDKRPMMADLRESGAIEQDADIIMFIYRDEVYNENSEDQGVAEIIIAKHRNGEIGTRKLAFVGKYTKFANLTNRDDD